MTEETRELFDTDTNLLMQQFPEARLTIRDRLPINLILTVTIISLQKSILNIDYSEEELKEAILGFADMIPDELKDEDFNNDLDASRQQRSVTTRPEFCGVPASDEYCQQHGIETVKYIETFDYHKVLHACFNLLMRRHMLLKVQPKEIFTGRRARKDESEYEPEEEPEEL